MPLFVWLVHMYYEGASLPDGFTLETKEVDGFRLSEISHKGEVVLSQTVMGWEKTLAWYEQGLNAL